MTGQGSPDGRRGDVCPGATIQPGIAGAMVRISRLQRGNAPHRSPMEAWKAYGNRTEARLYSITVVHGGSGERSGAMKCLIGGRLNNHLRVKIRTWGATWTYEAIREIVWELNRS